jgi:hypothetical protein
LSNAVESDNDPRLAYIPYKEVFRTCGGVKVVTNILLKSIDPALT